MATNDWFMYRILRATNIGSRAKQRELIKSLSGVADVASHHDVVEVLMNRDPDQFPTWVKDQTIGNLILERIV